MRSQLQTAFAVLGFFVCSMVLGLVPSAQAAETAATKPFYRQVTLMGEIEPYVERVDLARLFVIQKTAKVVIENMEANVTAGRQEVTMATMRLIQNLIVQYRFSTVYFGWQDPRPITSIYAPVIEKQLVELKTLSDQVVENYGFDDSPYTQITANTFRQMQRLLQQLETLPIDASLKTKLRALWMPIGETIAVADQGDRPNTFAKAVPVIHALRALYAEFDNVSSSSAGFALVMELQGLSEFYAEFAQME